MGVRVVGGGGAVVRETVRLLAGRPDAAGGPERLLLDADVPERAASALRRARARGVARVVLLSWPGAEGGPALEEAVERSGLPFAILVPHFVYQDDLAFRASILGRGVYPLPIGPRGMSRVDARDAAEAAVRALLDPGHDNRIYPLVGPEPLTEEEVAGTWAHGLGRALRCADGRGPLVRRYRLFRDRGLRATCRDFLLMETLLPHPPRPFGLFVREALEKNGGDPG